MNTRTNNNELIPAGMVKRKIDMAMNKLVFFRSNLFRKGDYFPLSDVLMLCSQAMLMNVDFGVYEQDGGDLWLEYTGGTIRNCKGETEVYDLVKRHASLLEEFVKTITPA